MKRIFPQELILGKKSSQEQKLGWIATHIDTLLGLKAAVVKLNISFKAGSCHCRKEKGKVVQNQTRGYSGLLGLRRKCP